ncbi:MAG: Tetratricopeptide 2 repeat protein [Pedosphaera sp.]|nr:Tetratricopeptide 2 repeat protein [Pedosphaera sp.]
MTTDIENGQRKRFVTSLLPWLLGGGMFIVYLCTLYHQVTPTSLNQVMVFSGWSWKPPLYGPLTFLVTAPLRLFPASMAPLALNLLNALVAGLALTLLARSVALLPHDRTFDERQREQSEFSILSIPTAWLPPVFAVLVCGLQMTFWEHSIEVTGEMVNLLLFAYVIRCLLEFRIGQKDSWITRAAFAYGLGMANDWAMIGFFPLFVAAVVWIKGFEFFNVRFLLRTMGFGMLGLALILLFPIMVSFAHIPNAGFFAALRTILKVEKDILLQVPRPLLLLLSLTSILPVFVIGIRWASHFGDNSPIGIFLATFAFHVVHGLFLLACIWVAMDSPISPRQKGLGLPFLGFYYLGALSTGYFIGYFLLIFGTKPGKSRQSAQPFMQAINVGVTALVWLLAIAVPLALICKNFPQIQAKKASVRIFDRFFSRVEQQLPPNGAVVMSDNPTMLFYLQAKLNKPGKESKYLLLDTGAIQESGTYFKMLEKTYPQFHLSGMLTNSASKTPQDIDLVHLLEKLSQANNIYYLYPSFGYYFERFYQQPHGLVYQLKPYGTNSWFAPSLSKDLITENESFWKTAGSSEVPELTAAIHKLQHPSESSWWQRLLKSAHLTGDPNTLALQAGTFYSRALNYWGVELERTGANEQAGKCFEQAQQLNPNNVAAQINRMFNRNLIAGKEPVIQVAKSIEDKFGSARAWGQVLGEDGPFEDPNFCFELGLAFAKGGNYRQAIQQMDRVRQLAPNFVTAPIDLAQLYLFTQAYPAELSYNYPCALGYSNALVAADQALRIAPDDLNGLFYKGTSLLEMGAYAKAIQPLTQLISLQTNNYAAHLNRAIANLKVDNLDAAKKDYETVLTVAPKAFQVFYGLGEIAYRQKNFPSAINYYQLYLTNAPPNTDEFKLINTRLKEMKSGTQ